MEIKKGKMNKENGRHLTSGFTQAEVYARRQFCGNLEVFRPPEPLWNPLREAATTLAAMRGRHSRNEIIKKNYYLCAIKFS